MATWVSGDLDKATDETFDFLCTVCERKNKNTEAEKFCDDCKDYLCSVCFKFHNENLFKQTHKILDQAYFLPAKSVPFPAVSTENCKIHGDKPVDMYCRNHNVVGCSTCMMVQHSLGSISQSGRLISQPEGSVPLLQVHSNQTDNKSHESRSELQVPGRKTPTGILKAKSQGQYQSPQLASIQTNTKLHGSQSTEALIKIKGSRKYKVTSFSDIKRCSINAICTLEDGTIVLSDYNNRNLKFLDNSTYAVTATYPVSGDPSSVCSVSNKRVAVCCFDKKAITLMSFGDRGCKKKEISTDFTCDSIAYADGKLFVSHWQDASVSVYEVSGKRLMCIGQMFSAPQGIAVSTDASKIYVADNNNGLIIVDKNAELVRGYKNLNLEARGVCCYSNGSVLVWGGSQVLQFSAGGVLIDKVLETDKECMAVCCNKNSSELFTGYYMSDEIEVYDISEK